MEKSERNSIVSMVKGIAIVLMVTGHSLPVDNVFRNYIYMFHMPLFFFVSGYCFKEKYLGDWRSFVRRRLRGLWWPFVKYGVPMVLLHNVFCALHVYGPPCDVTPYTLPQMAKAVLMQFAMSGAEPLLGAYWFLNTLLGASLLFYACRRVAGRRWTLVLLLAGSVVCLLLMPRVGGMRIVFRMFFAGGYMALGHLFKGFEKFRMIELKNGVVIVALGVVVGVGEIFLPHEMTDATLPTMLPCMVIAVAGVLMLWGVCERLGESLVGTEVRGTEYERSPVRNYCACATKRFAAVLDYLGDHTLSILTWHFLCFKVVTLLIIGIYRLPIEQLAVIPILKEQAAQGWWLVYVLAGVCGAVMIWKVTSLLSGK